MAFHFKQFDVEDKQSTLRVGTDSMLLGSWANPVNAKKILDIGTGCGVLALMMAQKSDAIIDAIDNDLSSVNEARENFTRSPWPDRLTVNHISLQSFSGKSPAIFDFIITNPPFFSGSLKSPCSRKNKTRHNISMPYEELCRSVSRLLSADGTFVLILPCNCAEEFVQYCRLTGLSLVQRMIIRSKPGSSPKRVLMEFKRHSKVRIIESGLVILDSHGKFSLEYLALTNGFHSF